MNSLDFIERGIGVVANDGRNIGECRRSAVWPPYRHDPMHPDAILEIDGRMIVPPSYDAHFMSHSREAGREFMRPYADTTALGGRIVLAEQADLQAFFGRKKWFEGVEFLRPICPVFLRHDAAIGVAVRIRHAIIDSFVNLAN
ncbi:hypothetical protein C404_16040 [Ralstonia sp. AU12-08]|nr:hypothetical protein C404_16040 [Ralstonia sp. AU12-08]